jgi:hypothetical protein
MKYSARERISNYIDLFIIFIQLDIFIWVLFELGFPFRPMVYQVGRIVSAVLIFELLVNIPLYPRLKSYFRDYWQQYIVTGIFIYIFNRFSIVRADNPLIFIYSRIFLALILILFFVKFIIRIERLRNIFRSFRVSPAQLILVSFATIILLGSFLLYLPYSRAEGVELNLLCALPDSLLSIRGLPFQE